MTVFLNHKFAKILVLGLMLVVGGCARAPQEKESRSSDRKKLPTPSLESGLSCIDLQGPELHDSLRTKDLSGAKDLPTGVVSRENPQLSSESEFVKAVAGGGSQGRLGQVGMRAALFARYSTDSHELGFYGLEALTQSAADDREKALREIWAHNASFGRSRVHRQGRILLVIWHNGVTPECWESVNAVVVRKLKTKTPKDEASLSNISKDSRDLDSQQKSPSH